MTSRIDLLRANALFAHSARQRTTAVADRGGLRRVLGSVAALRNRLVADAERLGVRELQASSDDEFAKDDTKTLLDRSSSRTRSWLLKSANFDDLYVSWFHGSRREEKDKVARILRFMRTVDARPTTEGEKSPAPVHPRWAQRIAATASLKRWRREAWLADGEAVVEACSSEFDRRGMRGWPGADHQLEVELERFVLSNYPNIGFAAQFRGYEGLDESGLTVPADATLLVDVDLISDKRLRAYREAGPTIDGTGRRPVVNAESLELDVESACLLSLARDIQLESLRNLRRHESHFETPRPPEDRLFPYSTGGYRAGLLMPVTLISSHAAFVAATRQAFGPSVHPITHEPSRVAAPGPTETDTEASSSAEPDSLPAVPPGAPSVARRSRRPATTSPEAHTATEPGEEDDR